MAHTPGPWKLVKGAACTSVRGLNGERVCDDESYYPQAVDEDDMVLIAAAPEMLAALKASARALEYVERQHSEITGAFQRGTSLKLVHDAIAKATGQQG